MVFSGRESVVRLKKAVYEHAIVFALAKDPVTGEQLVTLKDFMKHGSIVLMLCFAVLFLRVILGYWSWIGF